MKLALNHSFKFLSTFNINYGENSRSISTSWEISCEEKQITSILIVVTRMEFIVFAVITFSDTLMCSLLRKVEQGTATVSNSMAGWRAIKF